MYHGNAWNSTQEMQFGIHQERPYSNAVLGWTLRMTKSRVISFYNKSWCESNGTYPTPPDNYVGCCRVLQSECVASHAGLCCIESLSDTFISPVKQHKKVTQKWCEVERPSLSLTAQASDVDLHGSCFVDSSLCGLSESFNLKNPVLRGDWCKGHQMSKYIQGGSGIRLAILKLPSYVDTSEAQCSHSTIIYEGKNTLRSSVIRGPDNKWEGYILNCLFDQTKSARLLEMLENQRPRKHTNYTCETRPSTIFERIQK